MTLTEEPRDALTKKCPFCAELIQIEAVFCRFCNRDLRKSQLKSVALWLIVVAGLILGVATYVSPFLFLNSLKLAVENRNASALTSLVDFPSVRESVKTQMLVRLNTSVQTDDALKSNPFSKLGMVVGVAIVNQMVDLMVTPSGLIALLNGKNAAQFAKELDKKSSSESESVGQAVSLNLEEPTFICLRSTYRSFDQFLVELGPPFADTRLTLDLKRYGLLNWRIQDIQFGAASNFDSHVYVTGFTDGSPAIAAGVEEFDEVVAINSAIVHSADAVVQAVKDSGEYAQVTVWRGTQCLYLKVRLDKEHHIGIVMSEKTATTAGFQVPKGKISACCKNIEIAKNWARNSGRDAESEIQSGQIILVEEGASVIEGGKEVFEVNDTQYSFLKVKILNGNVFSNSGSPGRVWWIPNDYLIHPLY